MKDGLDAILFAAAILVIAAAELLWRLMLVAVVVLALIWLWGAI